MNSNETAGDSGADEKRMESMKLLDHTIRSYREQRYDLELLLETAPVRTCTCFPSPISYFLACRGTQDIQTVL
jgi:hypothetical protein